VEEEDDDIEAAAVRKGRAHARMAVLRSEGTEADMALVGW
jgi:hypothetical protein